MIYTEQRAKHEIGNWTAAKFPLDVWGLDMNCEPGPPTFLLCMLPLLLLLCVACH